MNPDSYQVVTDRIIQLLENDIVPWQQPWNAATTPRNIITQKPYRGINTLLLNSLMFEQPYFLTFKQALQLGGHVKRGEKASPVVFWKWLEFPDENVAEKLKRLPFLRYYSVFNIAQCEGISSLIIPATNQNRIEANPIAAAEQIILNMPRKPLIQFGGGRACYRPSVDRVDMPKPETFRTMEDYYSVFFHEIVHSTGHGLRLNRKGVNGIEGEWSAFGSTPYAKEELVAEMGAAMLCGQVGIISRTIENSASYIQSWLARLKNDKKLVIQAAAQAQKAADFILGNSGNEPESVE
jgi:antirestriction protein ArdC